MGWDLLDGGICFLPPSRTVLAGAFPVVPEKNQALSPKAVFPSFAV